MEEELFNIQQACGELKIGEDIYLRIVSRAIEQTREDLERLCQAHQQNGIEEIQAIAHRLKGDYANLRINCLSDIANRLNLLSKHGYDHSAAENLINELKSVFVGVVSAIENRKGNN